jgi:hypothetical protein
MEIQEQINELQRKLDALKKQSINEKSELIISFLKWRRGEQLRSETLTEVENFLSDELENKESDYPNEGDKVYFQNLKGDSNSFIYTSDYERAYRYGLLFKTEEEEREHAKKLETRKIILDRIKELNEGWVAEFSKDDNKHHIIYDRDEKCFKPDYYMHIQYYPKEYYLKSKYLTQQLIKEFGNDLKVLIEVL